VFATEGNPYKPKGQADTLSLQLLLMYVAGIEVGGGFHI